MRRRIRDRAQKQVPAPNEIRPIRRAVKERASARQGVGVELSGTRPDFGIGLLDVALGADVVRVEAWCGQC